MQAIPRVVSGEIMTGSTSVRKERMSSPVFEDAEFNIIGRNPDRRSSPTTATQPSARVSILGHVIPDDPASRRGGVAFWACGLALAASAFWISGGHALFERPAKAGGSVIIASVDSRVETADRHPVLAIDGQARNETSAATTLRPIRILVTDGAGATTRYTLSTGDLMLAAGDSYLFSSRLRAPPEGVRSVAVAFEPAN